MSASAAPLSAREFEAEAGEEILAQLPGTVCDDGQLHRGVLPGTLPDLAQQLRC